MKFGFYGWLDSQRWELLPGISVFRASVHYRQYVLNFRFLNLRFDVVLLIDKDDLPF